MSCFQYLQRIFLFQICYIYPMTIRSKILVTVQFFCLAYLMLFTNFLGQGLILLIQTFGFLLSLWAVIVMKPGKFNIQPELKQQAIFIRSGPYRLIRNPMYAGLILICGSSALHNLHISELLVFLLLIIVFLLKINLEEKYLSQSFGEDYLTYKKSTYRLIPFIY